jgi:hypothetical protein
MTKQSHIFQNIIRPKRTLEPLGGPISGFFSAAGFCARRERRIGSFSRQSFGTNFISFNLVSSFRARASRRSRSIEISKNPNGARIERISRTAAASPSARTMVAFLRVVFGLECEKKTRNAFKLFTSVASFASFASSVPSVPSSSVPSFGRSESYPSIRRGGKVELPLDFLRNDSSIDPPSKPPIDRSRTDDPFDRAHPSRGRDARITALIAYVLGDENRARGGGVGERERGHFPSVTCVDERDVRACLPIAPARARESSFVPNPWIFIIRLFDGL